MPPPLLQLQGLVREFPGGDRPLQVLKNVDLTIEAGEFVAIMGASGSGKSTLMNILGCLDRPTRGRYLIEGQDVADLDPDELARLRREHFGFIFQRYQLLGMLDALGNVEVPAVYAGQRRDARRARARQLLERLGLGERLTHRPSQLSGGQQQRVSIARALMNGGRVIFADEPTGALDSQSGREVLDILGELHAQGHTIILVTHEAEVAAHAERLIELKDGEIIADRRTTPVDAPAPAASPRAAVAPPPPAGFGAGLGLDRLREAFKMALSSMRAHRLRSFLTMLGIIIGIASVVSVVALGRGSQERILSEIRSIGTNTITVQPGSGFGDRRANRIRTLRTADSEALATLPYVDSATPAVATSRTLRYGSVEAPVTVHGVGPQFFRVRGMELESGRVFDASAIDRLGQEAVIDQNTRKTFFPNGDDPLGAVVLLGSVPVRVIGLALDQQSAFGNPDALNIWMPVSSVQRRMLGQDYLNSIRLRITDDTSTDAAEEGINQMLLERHGIKDFFTSNSDSIRQTVERTTSAMTLLITAIAVISLVVGGIGVMNIMLVTVTERTKEIGVRMAVGARRADVMAQFLIEAVLVCMIGGALGVALALGLGFAFGRATSEFQMVYSNASIVAAFACSTLIGVAFGFLPARRAARLDPVEALARE